MVEHGIREMPVTAQVDILSLNRSGLVYATLKGNQTPRKCYLKNLAKFPKNATDTK